MTERIQSLSSGINKHLLHKGFTLLELLVVIAIIGLLSTLAVAALDNARTKASDVKRISDLRQLSKALELYYDENQQYPHQDNYGGCNSSDNGGCDPGGWLPDLVAGGFIGSLPFDPTQEAGDNNPYTAANNHTYSYNSFSADGQNNQHYQLLASLEDENNENTCEFKCWPFFTDSSSPGRIGQSWCDGAGYCQFVQVQQTVLMKHYL